MVYSPMAEAVETRAGAKAEEIRAELKEGYEILQAWWQNLLQVLRLDDKDFLRKVIAFNSFYWFIPGEANHSRTLVLCPNRWRAFWEGYRMTRFGVIPLWRKCHKMAILDLSWIRKEKKMVRSDLKIARQIGLINHFYKIIPVWSGIGGSNP